MNEDSPTRPARSHLPVLDGVRGVAILLVFVAHFTTAEVDDHLLDGSALDRLWAKLAVNGASGVDLFFVLSGFLITGILLRERGRPGYWLNFYARRVLRIFPLYYLALVVALIVAPALGAKVTPAVAALLREQAWLWTYTGNIATGVYGVHWKADWLALAHFWSLCVEEQFYLVWPLLVALVPSRRLLPVVLALSAVSFALKLWLWRAGLSDAVYALTPCRMDGLCLGAAVAIVAQRQGGLSSLLPAARAVLAATLAGVFALAFVSHRGPLFWWTTAFVHTNWVHLYAAALVLVLEAGGASRVHRFLESAPLRFFGRYSYGLYVIHFMLRPTLVRLLRPAELGVVIGSRVLAVWLFAAVGVGISVLLALASYHLFEKRFLALKVRFGGAP